MSDYTLGVYELAVMLYEDTDKVGIPLHHRPSVIREAWIAAARRKIASCAVSMDDIATTGVAR
jgi:hypothetical protein